MVLEASILISPSSCPALDALFCLLFTLGFSNMVLGTEETVSICWRTARLCAFAHISLTALSALLPFHCLKNVCLAWLGSVATPWGSLPSDMQQEVVIPLCSKMPCISLICGAGYTVPVFYPLPFLPRLRPTSSAAIGWRTSILGLKSLRLES